MQIMGEIVMPAYIDPITNAHNKCIHRQKDEKTAIQFLLAAFEG